MQYWTSLAIRFLPDLISNTEKLRVGIISSVIISCQFFIIHACSCDAVRETGAEVELSETDEEHQPGVLGFSETEESGTDADENNHSGTSPDSTQAAQLPDRFNNLKVISAIVVHCIWSLFTETFC